MKIDPKKSTVPRLDIQEGIPRSIPGAKAAYRNPAQVVESSREAVFY